MSLLEELLAPIEGDIPVGPNLRDSNEFAAIERAFLDADQPALTSPTGVEEEVGDEFEVVVELAKEFLRDQSKDLKVAVLLAVSLLRVEGFAGFAEGLELIKGLLEQHWDDLHPPIPGRVPILDWMGSEDVSFALYLSPLTQLGQRHSEYKEWVAEGGDGKENEGKGADSADEGRGFGSGFAQTSWEWYQDLSGALHRCGSTLSELDAFGKERFKEAGEKPPRYASLADALKRVTAAADDLLGRKPAPPKPSSEPAMRPAEGGVPGQDGAGSDGQAASSAPTVVISAEPRTPEEAALLVATAARVLRRERPGDPSGYLLSRALRWGELRAGGEHLDPRMLDAPTTAQRTHLKSLFLDKKFDELLEASEELMATPVGRGWLDLQRYAVLSADKLGQEYKQVGFALRSAVSALLRDLPAVLGATLMDDSPTASRDTMSWLEAEELVPGPEAGEGREERSRAAEADRIIRDAGFDRASSMAHTGDPEGAVEMLMERAEHERSARDRFITKAEAAGIMVDHDMAAVARPILDELLALIDKHQLEAWEPANVIAKPMGLLFRCLDPQNESSLKQQLHPRLAKLDPLLAMQVNRRGRSSPQAAAPEPEGQGTPEGEGNG
jgi:type VI secretion system protein ImpA